jgi:hypothetical protein
MKFEGMNPAPPVTSTRFLIAPLRSCTTAGLRRRAESCQGTRRSVRVRTIAHRAPKRCLLMRTAGPGSSPGRASARTPRCRARGAGPRRGWSRRRWQCGTGWGNPAATPGGRVAEKQREPDCRCGVAHVHHRDAALQHQRLRSSDADRADTWLLDRASPVGVERAAKSEMWTPVKRRSRPLITRLAVCGRASPGERRDGRRDVERPARRANGMSSGSLCRSPSIVTIASPRAYGPRASPVLAGCA